MIRVVLALASLAILVPAQARLPVTFQEAVTAYQEGRDSEARASFVRMAEAGFPAAQFNLGAMMLHGDGGRSDPVEGALWVRLAADAGFGPAGDAASAAAESLDGEQREAFNERLPHWQERFSRAALLQRHAPVHCAHDCREQDPADGHPPLKRNEMMIDGVRVRLDRRQPNYPAVLARKGIPGYVEMGAWVGRNGQFEHPHVIFSDPDGIFNESALEAIANWKLEWIGTAPETLPRYVSQSILFRLDGRSWERKARRQLERLIEQWDENTAAAYRAVWLAGQLEFDDLTGGAEGLVSQTHEAARAGVTRAQIDLHSRLKAGNGVKEDEESAMFWLKQAAFQGDSRAQFLLGLRGEFDQPVNDALLRSAAENGSVAAIMTVLKKQLEVPADADRELLAELVERLPRYWYRINPDHSLVERAKELSSG